MPPLRKRQRLILLWSAASLLVFCLAVCVALYMFWNSRTLSNEPVEGLTSVLSRDITSELVSFQFTNVRTPAGINFTHFPAKRQSLLPEDMGSGLAWGDFDDDGDPDLFLVNFAASILDDPAFGGSSALYRNNGDGTFTDVTEQTGIHHRAFGMGASWADYDNDDDLDLYVTEYGSNRLYQNNITEAGQVFFTDVTQPAGVTDNRFSAGASWADYDNDGDVDLYVSNYVEFVYRPEDMKRVTRQYGSETPFTLNPSTYSAQANALFRNNGDGTFTDVAPGTPVANATGRSMGAVWFDFDLDGHVDLYVANDVSENGVYRNNGDGSFTDIGPSSLAADYRGAMGLAVGDYEPDGDFDLFVTHWIAQENAFFENMHMENWLDDKGKRRLFFMDSAETVGLGQISLKMVGWSTGFSDLDNDGLLDLWVVNGNTLEEPGDNRRLKPQRMQLYRQQKDKGFYEIGQQASLDLERAIVGRGGAQADFDGDGMIDIAVMAHGGSPLLLRNTTDNPHHWVRFHLRQVNHNTRALGARVLVVAGSHKQLSQAGADGAYLSQGENILHFGLGEVSIIDRVTVFWPDGASDTHHDLAVDRLHLFTHRPDYSTESVR